MQSEPGRALLVFDGEQWYLFGPELLEAARVPEDVAAAASSLPEPDVAGFSTEEQAIRENLEFLQAVMAAKSQTMGLTLQMLGHQAGTRARVISLAAAR